MSLIQSAQLQTKPTRLRGAAGDHPPWPELNNPRRLAGRVDPRRHVAAKPAMVSCIQADHPAIASEKTSAELDDTEDQRVPNLDQKSRWQSAHDHEDQHDQPGAGVVEFRPGAGDRPPHREAGWLV